MRLHSNRLQLSLNPFELLSLRHQLLLHLIMMYFSKIYAYPTCRPVIALFSYFLGTFSSALFLAGRTSLLAPPLSLLSASVLLSVLSSSHSSSSFHSQIIANS